EDLARNGTLKATSQDRIRTSATGSPIIRSARTFAVCRPRSKARLFLTWKFAAVSEMRSPNNNPTLSPSAELLRLETLQLSRWDNPEGRSSWPDREERITRPGELLRRTPTSPQALAS
ncbi:hypothetical protein FOZ63_025030, partial [Perkinsus olseni]